MAWIDADFTEAVFFTNGADLGSGTAYGKLQDGRIVTNIGFPDFYIPGWVLDRTLTYTFEVTFDPDSPDDSGGRLLFAQVLRDSSPDSSYYDDPQIWDWYGRFYDGSEVTDTVTFTVTPDLWTGIDSGFDTIFFEADMDGAIASMRYMETEGGGGGPPPVAEGAVARSAATFVGARS